MMRGQGGEGAEKIRDGFHPSENFLFPNGAALRGKKHLQVGTDVGRNGRELKTSESRRSVDGGAVCCVLCLAYSGVQCLV